MKTRILMACLVIILLAGCTSPAAKQEEVDAETLDAFETELDNLRQQMMIPGMSAAVVKDGELVWARGLGHADIEHQIPATPETPYHLASVTKTFAALVIMQLVQEGKLSLDDPVSRYGVSLPEGDAVLVRHLMSHTSEGTPGAHYQYNGARYGLLSQVVLAATGRSLQEWVYERILQPLGMENTAPSPPAACAGLSFAPTCERVYAALAKPYFLDTDFNPLPGFNEDYFNAGAGLMSTVVDLAKYDAALDANTLVTAATKQQMWTPTVSNSGQDLPYGLGWFTQSYRGTRLIWHSGFSPPSTSALFLKLPEEGLTLIVLANTDLLSRSYQAGHGDANDVLSSLVAVTFYKRVVLAAHYDQPLPVIDWSGDDSTVTDLIKQVQDEAVRELLYKEFQARRALASSLADLKAQAERLASMRTTAEEVAKNLEPQILDLYVGTYEFPEAGGLTLSVTRVENKLYAAASGSALQELLPLSTTRFFVPHGYDFYQLNFSPDAASGTCRLVLTIYGQSFTARRK
ncbi:MAG: serine hydrolase [Anaerolineales bacterium]|nr:serine hydrolase [Anaerolineales bacterium]